MAFVPSDTWMVGFTFKDNNGNTANFGLDYPASMTYEEVLTAAGVLATALALLSDAKIIGYNISTSLLNDDPAAPAASSEVERKLMVTLGNTAGTKALATIQIPSPRFEAEQPRTDAVNDSYGPWVGVRNLLTAGNLGANNGPVHWLGTEDFGTVTRAVIGHRSRKPRD